MYCWPKWHVGAMSIEDYRYVFSMKHENEERERKRREEMQARKKQQRGQPKGPPLVIPVNATGTAQSAGSSRAAKIVKSKMQPSPYRVIGAHVAATVSVSGAFMPELK